MNARKVTDLDDASIQQELDIALLNLTTATTPRQRRAAMDYLQALKAEERRRATA